MQFFEYKNYSLYELVRTYVNSRAEKKVAERLRAKGFEVFCPMSLVVKQWSDRKKKVEEPYFRSYVFVKFDLNQERMTVLSTLGVVNVVYWLKKPAVIRDGEMQMVMDFFDKHEKIQPVEQHEIEEGDSVSLGNGLFKGQTGIILRKTKRTVTLELKQLGMVFTAAIEEVSMKCVRKQEG